MDALAGDPRMADDELHEMMSNARAASAFLKALSNETRLMILCLLAEGEKSVTELEDALQLRQPTVSQQLARLRAEGLVSHRRHGKAIYYALTSSEARQVVQLLYKLFCANDGKKRRQRR
jgi:DNA-binding transcriptional ArsR family regulator